MCPRSEFRCALPFSPPVLRMPCFRRRPSRQCNCLSELGHQVVFPSAADMLRPDAHQHRLSGEATALVRHHVEVFEDADCDAVVAPSGSCVGSVRHQHAMVARRAGDEALAKRAEAVASRTYELSELLVDVLGVRDVGAYYPHRVTYHPTCHSLRMLRVGEKPLELLRHVRGINSGRLADGRLVLRFRRNVRDQECRHVDGHARRQDDQCHPTGAEVCTAGDSSCLMHIGGGLGRIRSGVRTVHLAEILAATEETEHVAAEGAR